MRAETAMVKNCPRCSFLMDDHESICTTCAEAEPSPLLAADPGAAAAAAGAVPASVQLPPSGHGASTAVLERPTVVPLSDSATFRPPSSGGVSWPAVIIGSLLAAALTVGVVMGLRHEGPLAVPLQQIGLTDPPVVSVPDQWVALSSADAGFSVHMPAGAVNTSDSPEMTALGVSGFTIDLGAEGRMIAVSTDFGQGPAAMRDKDTDAGFGALVDYYIAGMGLGEETVRREVQTSHGRAVDSVIVLDDRITTRARFMLIGDRFVVLQTGGPDSGAAVLDEAHPRLIDSFDPN